MKYKATITAKSYLRFDFNVKNIRFFLTVCLNQNIFVKQLLCLLNSRASKELWGWSCALEEKCTLSIPFFFYLINSELCMNKVAVISLDMDQCQAFLSSFFPVYVWITPGLPLCALWSQQMCFFPLTLMVQRM